MAATAGKNQTSVGWALPTYLDSVYLFRLRLMATEVVDPHFLSLVLDVS
jgi:hypothetical protein